MNAVGTRASVLSLLLLVVATLALWGQTGYVSPEEQLPLPPPEQPIPYSHKLHVGTLGLQCNHCHTPDREGFLMQFPGEETCMQCHSAVKKDSPHIEKLAGYAERGERVPWEQIYRVPDYIWFAHESHSGDAAIECAACHGPVAEREAMFKELPTDMVSCMNCHAKHGAPNDCNVCHDLG